MEQIDYAKELGYPLKVYHDVNGIRLTDFASFLIDEHGGFPKKNASRISITKASTGEEDNTNSVIYFALDGKEVGFLLAMLNRPISYRGKEADIFLRIDPDNKYIKKGRKGKETFFGKEIELYGDSIWMESLEELFDFYEEHKVELDSKGGVS